MIALVFPKGKSRNSAKSKKPDGVPSHAASASTKNSTKTANPPKAPVRRTAPSTNASSNLSAYRKTKQTQESACFLDGLLDTLEPDNSKVSIPKQSIPSDYKKRKGPIVDRTIMSSNQSTALPATSRSRTPIPSSSDVDIPADWLSSEPNDASSSVGFGGPLSSEDDEMMEPQSKRARVQTLHEDLVGLEVEDLAYNGEFDLPIDPVMPPDNLDNNLNSSAPLVTEEDDSFQAKPLPHLHRANHTTTNKSLAEQKSKRHLVNATSSTLHVKPDISSHQHSLADVSPPTPGVVTKPKIQGLDWKKVMDNVPISTSEESRQGAKMIVDHSVPDLNPSDAPSKENIGISEPTDFLADVPRMGRSNKVPQPSKRALAKAEADRHLPESVRVEAFEPRPSSKSTSSGSIINTVDDKNEGENLKFFWLDYQEVDGLIYLFGKVLNRLTSKYVACCLIVEGIQRNLFVLPKDTIVDGERIVVFGLADEERMNTPDSLVSENRGWRRCKAYG